MMKHAIYALGLVNIYGLKLRMANNPLAKKQLRIAYAKAQLKAFNIHVVVENPEKLPADGQYLLLSNHRSVIDPPIVELVLESTAIYGLWISKKELYNSLFFGLFVRNGGSILLDREQSRMGGFFADIKQEVAEGHSIFIFPEGTRNKSGTPLAAFKEGSRIIALKNRLPILPIFIKTDAEKVLKQAAKDNTVSREIRVVVGDLLPYKSRESLEESYRSMFEIPSSI